jgi:hypothetical protein
MDAASMFVRAVGCAITLVCLVVALGPAGAGAAGLRPVTGPLKVKLGIADQKAATFDDERLHGLGIRYARRSVAWDALRFRDQRDELDAWVAGVQRMGAEPLITFARSRHREDRLNRLPGGTEFLGEFNRFRKRYPGVKTYSAWNEANHCGNGTCKRPDLVARYYNAIRRNCPGCKVVAADLLDQPNMVSWVRAFRRAAGFEPRYWGLHDYLDANRFQTVRTTQLLRAVKGEVWLTEVGGLVARRNKSTVRLPQGKAHAADAMRFIFDRLARLSPRVARIYVYHWRSSTPRDSWDSALVGSDGVRRPSLGVLERVVRQQRIGAAAAKSGGAPAGSRRRP